MDYDYYDESRTRFQVHSGPSVSIAEEQKTLNLFEVGACFSFALVLVAFAWFANGFLQFLLLWLAFSMLLGPFAPLTATGGMCRVGVGELLPALEEQRSEEAEDSNISNPRQRRKFNNGEAIHQKPKLVPQEKHGNIGEISQGDSPIQELDEGSEVPHDEDGEDDEDAVNEDDFDENFDRNVDELDDCQVSVTPSKPGANAKESKNETEWTDADIDLLKKLMIRYPKGMLKRWEVIAEAYDGSHSVESVVKMSKAVGERKKGNQDSYSEFLAKRKGSTKVIDSPLSQRWESSEAFTNLAAGEGAATGVADSHLGMSAAASEDGGKQKKEWSETEDKALLSALKTFPKDTPMRWEKVALAVPSRTKQQCFRRFAELKESFRSTKVDKN